MTVSLLRCNCTGQKTACIRHKTNFILELSRACADSKLNHCEKCDMKPSWIHLFILSQVLSSHTVSISHKKSSDVTGHPVRIDNFCAKGFLYCILQQCFNFDTVRQYISTPVAAKPASQVDSCHSQLPNSPRFDHQ